MNLRFIRSQFAFHNSERFGILLLLAVIIGLLYVKFFVSFSEEDTFEMCTSELIKIQNDLDSLRLAELESPPPKVYPFNPNFMTEYKAYTLGITAEAFERLQQYRAAGKWINSVADFKEVTGVSDSLLATFSASFKFPDWVSRPKGGSKPFAQKQAVLSEAEKKDLNTATSEELQSVYGIGPGFGRRIVTLREQLGGFSDVRQLYAIRGLDTGVVKRVILQFTVRSPVILERVNVNTATASDLATLPGFSFETGKKIWEFVRVREGIIDLSELLKIDGITPQRFKLIELYLYAE